MSRGFRFLTILACALPLACSDTSTTPTATAPPPVPRLSANPASNGSAILRFDEWTGYWTIFWYDPGLDVIAGLASFDIVQGWCDGGDPAFTPSDWKVVAKGNLEGMFNIVARLPETYIFIWDGGWESWRICHPNMRGMGAAAWTQTSDNGASTVGVTASGQVSDGNGQTYRFGGHVRSQTRPDGTTHEELAVFLRPLLP